MQLNGASTHRPDGCDNGNSDGIALDGQVCNRVDWLSRFLWHWEGSGVLYADAANAIEQIYQQSDGHMHLDRLPDPQVLVRTLENS